MRYSSILILFALFTQAAEIASGSTVELSDIPPPKAPWIAPVPERGQWAIRVADPSATAEPEGSPEQSAGVNRMPVAIESMTWNTVKRDIFEFPDGSTTTLFYYAGYVLVEGQTSQGKAAPVLVQQLPGTDFINLRASGWLGMDWLAENYFVEPQYYRSKTQPGTSDPVACYYFRKPEGKAAGAEDWLPELHAWIRADDLQPVAFGIGRKNFEFQTLAPPTAAPQMTQEQAARLLDLKDQNERMVRLRERNKRLRKD